MFFPQQCLYFLPELQGQGSPRAGVGAAGASGDGAVATCPGVLQFEANSASFALFSAICRSISSQSGSSQCMMDWIWKLMLLRNFSSCVWGGGSGLGSGFGSGVGSCSFDGANFFYEQGVDQRVEGGVAGDVAIGEVAAAETPGGAGDLGGEALFDGVGGIAAAVHVGNEELVDVGFFGENEVVESV